MPKKYQIILADPPWKLKTTVSSRAIEKHYATMDVKEIKQLTVPAAKNAILFLWATSPKLTEALSVLSAWGFGYKTHLVWDKEIIGCGWWVRGQHELLLIGVRGKMSPPKQSLRIPSVIKCKRAKHSDKPDYFREKIQEWYPNMSKLEMFYRNHRPLFSNDNWDVWGNEVKSDIELKK